MKIALLPMAIALEEIDILLVATLSHRAFLSLIVKIPSVLEKYL
jgi:hypothetical protein